MKCLLVVVLSLAGLVSVKCTNILAITGLPSPSHHIFNDAVFLELANQGYNVTLLGLDEDRHHHPNYTHVVMEGIYAHFQDNHDIEALSRLNDWDLLAVMWQWMNLACELCAKTKGVQALLNYPDDFKFDLVIFDTTAGDCLLPIIEKFGNPPVVGITAFLLQPNTFRNVIQTYTPYMTRANSDRMTFWQRVDNTFWMAMYDLTREYLYLPYQDEIANTYFPFKKMSMHEHIRRISLLLVNYNPALNYVKALPPNIIPIGGVHIKEKKLPEDVKAILDNSKHGVIVFSLGTNVRSSRIGKERIQSLLDAFEQLKETVIWKFEVDGLENVPKNVIIRKWLPQSAILAHPKTKLVVFHGGALSLHEAVYHGLPVIIVPFFMDQKKNAGLVVYKGIGKSLTFADLNNTNTVYTTINEVLQNERYTINAKRLSALYRDQPMKPIENAIHWIKYVLRHGTAAHFDLPTRDMGFLQLTNLDLFLFASLVFIVIISLVFVIVYLLVKICCGKRVKKHEKTL